MEKLKKVVAGHILAILGVGFTIFMFIGLFTALEKRGIESADTAGWVQAIGTFGAIVGAALIAGLAERQRKKEALAVAKMTAATMTYRLIATCNVIVDSYEWFDGFSKNDGDYQDFLQQATLLDNQPKWTVEDLSKLAPLPGDCAYKVAAGLDRLNSAVALMKRSHSDEFMGEMEFYRKDRAKVIKDILGMASMNFGSAIKQMLEHTDGIEDFDIRKSAKKKNE